MALTEQEWEGLFDVRRTEWDPDEVRAASTRTWEDGIDVAEVHHTGARGPADLTFDAKAKWLLLIERFHEITKGWSDIFYHIFIFADGSVWEGRQPLRTSQGNISNAFTVHIPGNDTGMTEAQYASFLRVVHAITDGNPAFLRDHQARVGPSGTYCCGDNNRVFVERAREELSTYKETTMEAPLSVQEDIEKAIELGIATSFGDEDGDGLVDLINEGESAETWRAVVFATRAYEKAVEEAVERAVERVGEMEIWQQVGNVDTQSIVDQVTANVLGALENTEFTVNHTGVIRLS